jgi:hypothetical protein
MKFKDTEFLEGEVGVDGIAFKNCRFKNSRLIYSGGAQPIFEHCSFENITWGFNNAAENTIRFLRYMSQDNEFRPVAENILLYIGGNPTNVEVKE